MLLQDGEGCVLDSRQKTFAARRELLTLYRTRFERLWTLRIVGVQCVFHKLLTETSFPVEKRRSL